MTGPILPTLARRTFVALFGGVSLTGFVTRDASAKAPTLIVPDSVPPQLPVMADLKYPLLSACGTETCAMIRIRELTPRDEFREWLEGGLRVARLYNGRSEAGLNALFAAGATVEQVRGTWA